MIETNPSPEIEERHRDIIAGLESVAADLGIRPPGAYRVGSDTVKNRRWRRRRHERLSEHLGMMTVREHDGVLLLDEGWRPALAETRGDDNLSVSGRRSRRGPRRIRFPGRRRATGELVAKMPFERLERSQIATALETLDKKLTPHFGQLRQLDNEGTLREADGIHASGRVLLFVHGTFSNTDNILGALKGTRHGQEFIGAALRRYDQVATFDHRTLGVSPIINARELALLTRHSKAKIDVICHSRGGLVTRWWLEALDRKLTGQCRAVFVGCPLAGTGLAAPPNLRGALSMLANINRALGHGASLASGTLPFMAVASGVFRVISSVTSFLAKTPVVDAAVALVPGLYAQARIRNNRELDSLRRDLADPRGRYFSVQANFESEDPSWRFWKYFRDVKARAADWATDKIFAGPNDLVVDTPSMVDFQTKFTLPRSQTLDFGTTDKVHHTNYFEQRRTVGRLAKWLEVG